jgi:hypothetical protein
MKSLTRFQYTVLARLLARDFSGAAMKIDCRSLDALRDRGLVEYNGPTSDRTEDGRTRHTAPFEERTAGVTDRGRKLYEEDRHLRDEVATHLRLERDRATERASSYEATARLLKTRASHWEQAYAELGGTR